MHPPPSLTSFLSPPLPSPPPSLFLPGPSPSGTGSDTGSDSEASLEGAEVDSGTESEGEDGGAESAAEDEGDDEGDDEIAQIALRAADEAALKASRIDQAALLKARSAAPKAADSQTRLRYLMQQGEVFAHFLAGTGGAKAIVASSKSSSSSTSFSTSSSSSKPSDHKLPSSPRGKGRKTEEAEDAELLLASEAAPPPPSRVSSQPKILSAECVMHPYQLEGLNWLVKLHDNGINGVLADEMGLGKTLQTIALLAYLRESRGVRGQHLVVVPKSVTGNWIREVKVSGDGEEGEWGWFFLGVKNKSKTTLTGGGLLLRYCYEC